jgi:hypothetical protein
MPYVQDLVSIARGTALILNSISEPSEHETLSEFAGVFAGLSFVLQRASQKVDAYFFRSVGELNASIKAEYLRHLIESELESARATNEQGW